MAPLKAADRTPAQRATCVHQRGPVALKSGSPSSTGYRLPINAFVRSLFARTGSGIIWIDDALGGSARRRLRTLSHRSVATFEVEVHHVVVDLKANRVAWIVGLGLCRRGKQDRADRQYCAKQAYCVLHIRRPHCGGRKFWPDIRSALVARRANEVFA
jgi:hypothetical protein